MDKSAAGRCDLLVGGDALTSSSMRANLCVRRHLAAHVKPERVHPAYRRELAEGDPVCFPDGRARAAHSADKTTEWPTRPLISRSNG